MEPIGIKQWPAHRVNFEEIGLGDLVVYGAFVYRVIDYAVGRPPEPGGDVDLSRLRYSAGLMLLRDPGYGRPYHPMRQTAYKNLNRYLWKYDLTSDLPL